MGTTFVTLKEDAVRGYRIRNLYQGTVPTGGNTTLFLDTSRQEPQGMFDRVDAFVKFVSGSNLNVTRRITGFSPGNQTITFAPALTASVASGDQYDIFLTFDPDRDVRLAVNSALRDMAPERMITSIATTCEVASTGIVGVPSIANNANSRLLKVERPVGTLNSDWNWRTLVEDLEYRKVDSGGAMTLELQYLSVASTVLRFTYEKPAAELTNDTDSTDEPASLILLGARKYLAMQENDESAIARWGREFEAAKNDYYKIRPAQNLNIPRFTI